MDDKTAAFRDFWPYYLQEHAHAGTRAMHYAGTSLVVLLIAALPVAGKWWMIPAMPLAGYGFAWIGHSLIEHNRPATFRYPFWSLRRSDERRVGKACVITFRSRGSPVH